jgi:hypothetical protein
VNIRYQADADLNQAIVTGVLRREPADELFLIWAASDAEEWIDRIAKLPL